MNYSVLMSLYIKENNDYFVLSIESMLNQTLKPEQIVLVIDGPITEELDNTVLYYQEKYRSIMTIVRLEKNMGLGLALNEGLKKCRNQLIARMDTDDISFKDRCSKQVEKFVKNANLSILGGWTHEFIDDHNNPLSVRKVPVDHNDIIKFSKRRSPFNHPTVMYKKNDVLSIGGYNDIIRNEDYDLFYRMLQSGFESGNIGEPLIYFRSNKDNLKRRKSFSNCMGYINVSKKMYKDGYISLNDFLYVSISQIFFYIMPSRVVSYVSKNFLRSDV